MRLTYVLMSCTDPIGRSQVHLYLDRAVGSGRGAIAALGYWFASRTPRRCIATLERPQGFCSIEKLATRYYGNGLLHPVHYDDSAEMSSAWQRQYSPVAQIQQKRTAFLKWLIGILL